MPPIGRAMKPTANVLKDASNAMTGGRSAGKNAFGNISAAAVPYRKKSYHSMLVPANAVKAILRTERSSRRAVMLISLSKAATMTHNRNSGVTA